MDANPYQSPNAVVTDHSGARRRSIVCAVAGGGFFLLPTWIAVVQWTPLILGYQQAPNWTMNLDNMFGRISAVVGASPMFVFIIPLAGAAAAILCSPLSRSWKIGALLALYPLHFVQFLIIVFALMLCGVDPS